jgi:mRNA interferase RelE/StbE
MNAAHIQVRPAARRTLLDMDKPTRRRLQRAIDALAEHARPAAAIALTGLPGALRIRVSAHQVVYEIQDDKNEVLILLIEPDQQPRTNGGKHLVNEPR